MPRHTLYAYVEGSDLYDIESQLVDQLTSFVASRSWVCSDAWVVNQRGDSKDPSLGPDDLPDWDLGINIALPDPGSETPGWYADVEETARYLAELHAATGRDFVIGIDDSVTGIAEDLFFIESDTIDLAKLRQMIGVGETS